MATFLIYSWSLLVKSWILSLPPSQPSPHRCCKAGVLPADTHSELVDLFFTTDLLDISFSNMSLPLCSFTGDWRCKSLLRRLWTLSQLHFCHRAAARLVLSQHTQTECDICFWALSGSLSHQDVFTEQFCWCVAVVLKMQVQHGVVQWGQRSLRSSAQTSVLLPFSSQVQCRRRTRNQTGKWPRLPAPVQQPVSADQRRPSHHYRPLETAHTAAIRRRAEWLCF